MVRTYIPKSKLTEQEELYCYEWMRTKNFEGSYRMAFDDEGTMTKKEANMLARKLHTEKKVQKKLVELKKALCKELMINDVSLLHEMYELSVLAKEEGRFKDSMEMKKLIGQQLGMWGNDVKVDHTINQIDDWVRMTSEKHGLLIEDKSTDDILEGDIVDVLED